MMLIPEKLKSAMSIFSSSMSMPVIATPLCDDDDNYDITAATGAILAAGATILLMKKFKEVMNKPSSNVWRIRWKYVHCRDCNHYFKTYDKLQYFCNQSCSYSFAMDNHIRPPLRWTSALIPCKNCDNFFFQYHSSHLFCSPKCRKDYNYEYES